MESYLGKLANRWQAFWHAPLTATEHKITEDLFAHSKGFALTITVCFAIGIYTVWDYVPRLWTVAFVVLFVAEVVIKIVLSGRFGKAQLSQQRSPLWRVALVLGNLWSGVFYGLILLVMFLPVTAEERLLLIAVFFGIIQVSAMSGAFFQSTTSWMLIPTIIPTIIGLLIIGSRTTYLLTLMLIVSTWSALLLGKLSATRFRYISNLNEENERLLNELSIERKIVDEERDRAELAVIKNSHLMAVASHDLRQPLHAIGLFHHALKNKDDTEDPTYMFDSIERSLDTLNSMFDSLLDISQLDAKAILPAMQHIDSQVVFNPLVEETHSAAIQKDLVFETDLHNSIIETDPVLLGRIIRNLLGNAVKFTDQGSITLHSSHTAAGLRLDIADTGVGISETDRANIFTEFYQGTSENDQKNGVGLGLSIVDRLCQLLGITLSMEANQPVGTVFSLCIPHGNEQPSSVAQTSNYEGEGNNLQNLITVFVDDDHDIRVAMERLLVLLGCNCLCFADTTDASELLRTEGIIPDLLICDYQLNTQLTGLDCIDLIRKQTGSNIPALLVSGEISTTLDNLCRNAGVPLISKPVSPVVLKQEIAKML